MPDIAKFHFQLKRIVLTALIMIGCIGFTFNIIDSFDPKQTISVTWIMDNFVYISIVIIAAILHWVVSENYFEKFPDRRPKNSADDWD